MLDVTHSQVHVETEWCGITGFRGVVSLDSVVCQF